MKKALFVILVLVLLVLVGCSSNQQNSGATPATGGNAQTSAGATAPAKSGNALDDYLKTVSDSSGTEFKINYNIKTVVQGQTTENNMTLAVKGKTKMRTDTETSYNGETTMGSVYFVNNKFYSCTETNGKQTCLEMQSSQQNTQSAIDLAESIKQKPSDYAIVDKGTKTVAGKLAKCFGVAYTQQFNVDVTVCYADGLPLYMSSSYNNFLYEMEATSYEKSVPDSWFEIPAGAETINIGQNMSPEDIQKLADQYKNQ